MVQGSAATAKKKLRLQVGRRTYEWKFLVADVRRPLIGADFLTHSSLFVDVRNGKLIHPGEFIATPLQRSRCRSRITGLAFAASADQPKLDKLFAEFPTITVPNFKVIQPKHAVRHAIETKGQPVHAKARPLPPQKLAAAKANFAEMAALGIIRRSKGPWSSPSHVVTKKDASFRMCGDYRRLNTVTTPDRYSIPLIADFTARLHGRKIFGKVDLIKGLSPDTSCGGGHRQNSHHHAVRNARVRKDAVRAKERGTDIPAYDGRDIVRLGFHICVYGWRTRSQPDGRRTRGSLPSALSAASRARTGFKPVKVPVWTTNNRIPRPQSIEGRSDAITCQSSRDNRISGTDHAGGPETVSRHGKLLQPIHTASSRDNEAAVWSHNSKETFEIGLERNHGESIRRGEAGTGENDNPTASEAGGGDRVGGRRIRHGSRRSAAAESQRRRDRGNRWCTSAGSCDRQRSNTALSIANFLLYYWEYGISAITWREGRFPFLPITDRSRLRWPRVLILGHTGRPGIWSTFLSIPPIFGMWPGRTTPSRTRYHEQRSRRSDWASTTARWRKFNSVIRKRARIGRRSRL